MRSCKETAELITRASHGQIKPREWLALQAHLVICRMCRQYRQQTETLRRAAQKLLETRQIFTPLSTSARQRIRQAMKIADKNN